MAGMTAGFSDESTEDMSLTTGLDLTRRMSALMHTEENAIIGASPDVCCRFQVEDEVGWGA